MDAETVATHVRNVDRRLERVEQILPTLATKEDLKGLLTRDDARGFLTKADIAGVPTQDDPKGFLTKADIAGMPTQDDPKGFLTTANIAGMPTQDDPKGFLTKADIAGMPTQDDPKGFATKLDVEQVVTVALEAHSEREGKAMRAFLLETIQHNNKDLTLQIRTAVKEDMRVLIESERDPRRKHRRCPTTIHRPGGEEKREGRTLNAGGCVRDSYGDPRGEMVALGVNGSPGGTPVMSCQMAPA